MQFEGTLLLRRSDVEGLLSLRDCIDAVEEIFRLQGEGKVPAPGILGVKATGGGLHVKAGLLPGDRTILLQNSTPTSQATTRNSVYRLFKA